MLQESHREKGPVAAGAIPAMSDNARRDVATLVGDEHGIES